MIEGFLPSFIESESVLKVLSRLQMLFAAQRNFGVHASAAFDRELDLFPLRSRSGRSLWRAGLHLCSKLPFHLTLHCTQIMIKNTPFAFYLEYISLHVFR